MSGGRTPEQRHDARIEKLERYVAGHPSDAKAMLDLAEAFFQKGYYYGRGDEWFEAASRTVDESRARHGDSARAFGILANAAYGRGDLGEAERCYAQAIDADPDDALAYVGLGNLHRQRGNLARAIDAFARAADLDPDLWQAHYNLGGALYADARDHEWKGVDEEMERAIYHLVTALRLGPFEAFVGTTYKDLGELFLHTRQYGHARRFFTRLLEHPEHATIAHYYLGLTHFSMGRYAAAIHHYKQFLAREPESALAWSKIALAHLELSEWDAARDACQQAISLEPGNLLARFSLGCIELDQRRYLDAERLFEALVDENPEYFPAYVELVKSHYERSDLGWLFDELGRQVQRFEQEAGFDGGRQHYQGARGRVRRRIDVLLAQIQEIGIDAFASMAEIVETIQTDSLRFQVWEHLYELSRRHRVEQVLAELARVGQHFSVRLGRAVLLLSQHIPEQVIVDAFVVDEEAIRRRAQRNKGPGDDLTAYLSAVDEVRAETRRFQAYLLLALAVKGTPTAEEFLTDHLGSDDPGIRASSALSLLFYGSEDAASSLREEADALPPEQKQRLNALIDAASDRVEAKEKVIELQQPEDDRPRRTRARPVRECCSVCGKDKREVDRLMSGNRAYICNVCISFVHRHRGDQAVHDREDHVCSFCGSSVFEVAGMFSADKHLICSRCLDSSVRLLAREEVDRYLRQLQ